MVDRNQGSGRRRDYKAEDQEPATWDDGNARGDYEHRQNVPQPGISGRPISSKISSDRRRAPDDGLLMHPDANDMTQSSPRQKPAVDPSASPAKAPQGASTQSAAAAGDDTQGRRASAQSHFGKGPHADTTTPPPSHDSVASDISERLTWSDEIDASAIRVEAAGGHVVLTGEVSSAWEKQAAEDEVRAIAGVKDVDNRLRLGKCQPLSS